MTVYLNGEVIELGGSPSLQDVLARHAPPAQPYAVALNAHFVPRGRHADTPLRDGDRIDVVIAAQGG